jgi:hypothetical protein
MKKVPGLIIILLLTMLCSAAAEKKQINDIDTDALTNETQISAKGAASNHMAIVWWIPTEFWDAVLSQDPTVSEFDKNAMLDAITGVSLLVIIQADISTLGSFQFYSKTEIEDKIHISYLDMDNQKHGLPAVKNINPDLAIVLSIFKPILSAAMGNMGNNMHFYVLSDKSDSSQRLVDPYKKGILTIKLSDKNNHPLEAEIEMPLNSLFIPRKCPNGKDAHVSWIYCPWTGKKLDD